MTTHVRNFTPPRARGPRPRRCGDAGGLCGTEPQAEAEAEQASTSETVGGAAKQVDTDRIAADPTDLPDPVDWSSPRTHEVTLTCEEHTAEVEPGVTFDYMTFDGQIPGPMVRVRQGDTVELTLENAPDNQMPHNVDLHAVYGTGGGAVATTAAPGEDNAMKFRADYPGAYIYHCAPARKDHSTGERNRAAGGFLADDAGPRETTNEQK